MLVLSVQNLPLVSKGCTHITVTVCDTECCKVCRAKDVQVEFTMLDPHVRATLTPDNQVC